MGITTVLLLITIVLVVITAITAITALPPIFLEYRGGGGYAAAPPFASPGLVPIFTAGLAAVTGVVYAIRRKRYAKRYVMSSTDPYEPDSLPTTGKEIGVNLPVETSTTLGKPREQPSKVTDSTAPIRSEPSPGYNGLIKEEVKKDEQIVERYPYVTFPKKTTLGENTFLIVAIKAFLPISTDLPQISQASTSIGVATDGNQEFEDILVSIDLQSTAQNFVVKGRGYRVIHVPVNKNIDSESVSFELVAKAIGYCSIVLEFMQKGQFVGKVELRTEVVNSLEPSLPGPLEEAKGKNIALNVQSFQYDDKYLGIIIIQSELSDTARNRYNVLIQRGPHIKQLDPDNPTPIRLHEDARDIFKRYFDVIEDNNTIPAIHDEKVRSIGKGLYREIFPQILKDFIWKHRDEIKHIHVSSKEEWIPWEIIIPFEGSKEDEFLCQRYNFSRFLFKEPISTVQIEKAKIIGLPNSSALKEELGWIKDTFSPANGFDATSASSHYEIVEEVLKKGGYDLLHFSSHGQHDRKAPLLSTISLENNQKLSPNDLLGNNSKFGENHPLVILNSCQSASQAYSITGVQSWVTNFIDAGAAAVIGTAWSVDEESAVKFTKALYTNLSKGNMTVAEALRKTRLDCKKTGNATWLAYVYYGSPALRIKFGA